MKVVALEELIRHSGFPAGADTSHPVYSVTKHAGFVPSSEYFKKQVFSRDLSGYKRVQHGDFAYATIHLDEGSIGIAPGDGLISPMYTVFRPNTELVEPRYLLLYLKSPVALSQYPRFGKGSVHRRKSISLAALGKLAVPLPALEEQRRIAVILDHADALRAKRRQVNTRLESLAESIFIDMFGDPDNAMSSGPTVKLGQIADLGGGRNLVADDEATASRFRVLKISAVTSGKFKPTESKPLPTDYEPPAEHMVNAGDLLISRANTTELVGAVAYVDTVPTNIVLPDKLWRFVWHDPESVPLFYCSLLQSADIRRRMSRLSSGTGGSMKNISKAKLTQLELPKVSVSQQLEFARRVSAIPQTSTLEFDGLFTSVQSRAFSGQL